MTAPTPRPEPEFEVVQEDDSIASAKVSGVLVTGVLVTIASVAVAGWFLTTTRTGLGRHTAASATAAPRRIAGIHQTPIERDRHGWELRERQRSSLDRYQWVNRERGIAKIPIDRAMQIVIDDAKKANRVP